jgi:hypothetical protein
MVRVAAIAILLCFGGQLLAAEQTHRADHVVVTYAGTGEAYPAAMARVIAAARGLAAGDFGFDMPETVYLRVSVGPQHETRLFTDGKDRFTLSARAEKDLHKPSETGIFHLYGMCHELGHLAQYRLIPRHDWLTTAGAEGWAHCLGSRLVDGVYAREGEKLWPDAYDYRADGMARLTRQLGSARRDEVTAGAGLWMELARIVGDKGLAPVFKAWGQVQVDVSDPGPALGKALLAVSNDPRLADWWKRAEAVLVAKRAKSDFAAKTLAAKDLGGKPKTLAHDDGVSAGMASLAGGGHAVRFEAPEGTWYLTAVSVYGSAYGAAAPGEMFHVWLCDEDFRAVADFPLPYSAFQRGDPKWVALAVTPTQVPAKFIVCVGFNPTATKGVFVHLDKEADGNSLTGLPGGKAEPFAKGDWMIRVQLDQTKAGRRPPAGRG